MMACMSDLLSSERLAVPGLFKNEKVFIRPRICHELHRWLSTSAAMTMWSWQSLQKLYALVSLSLSLSLSICLTKVLCLVAAKSAITTESYVSMRCHGCTTSRHRSCHVNYIRETVITCPTARLSTNVRRRWHYNRPTVCTSHTIRLLQASTVEWNGCDVDEWSMVAVMARVSCDSRVLGEAPSKTSSLHSMQRDNVENQPLSFTSL
jgi:hypothetical protein